MDPFPDPGIYPGIPEAEYRSWPWINWSLLKRVGVSLEQFRYERENPPEDDTPARRLGRILHAFVLEPDEAPTRYVCHPATYPALLKEGDWYGSVKQDGDDPFLYHVRQGRGRTRTDASARITADEDGWNFRTDADSPIQLQSRPWSANAAFCKEWRFREDEAGREIVHRDELEQARGMARRLLEIPFVPDRLSEAMTEVCVVWRDPQTGLLCKSRLDWWRGGQIGDLKTSARAVDADTFAWDVKRWGYAGQGAMYLDGLKAALKAMGKRIEGQCEYHWWAVQSFPPYTPALYNVIDAPDTGSAPWLEYGRQMWHGWLQRVAWAEREKEWPGHHHEGQPYPGIRELLLPGRMKLLPEEQLT